jgi:hypothetical protein
VLTLLDEVREGIAVRTRLHAAMFNSQHLARARSAQHVVVLGDSHSKVFDGWRLPGWWFDVVTVGGATASGIRNPNSATEALSLFRKRLLRSKPWQSVLMMLGEVDCGYIIFRRASKDHISLESSLYETVRRYEDFIRHEVAPDHPVLVMSAPLPTLPDDSSSWGDVAQRRADVQVSQLDRTHMTVRFNHLLGEVCAREGWRFVDSTTDQIDSTTGLVREDLVRHGSGDHHLQRSPYRLLIKGGLEAASQHPCRSPGASRPPRPAIRES